MSPREREARRAELAPVVSAAQRVAGLVAARAAGDTTGARALMDSFADDRELASGALLVAELSLGMLSSESGSSVEASVRELCLHLEAVLD